MPAGAELRIQQQMDNMAAWRRSLVSAVSNRTLLWAIADAADSMTYQNDVLGKQLYSVDQFMDNMSIGSNAAIQQWFTLHNSYFQDPAIGLQSWVNALTQWKWRAHQYWAMLYFEAQGNKLAPYFVFPRQDLLLGHFDKTTAKFTAGSGMDLSYTTGGMVQAVTSVTIGASTLTITATLIRVNSATFDLTVVFPANAPLNTSKVFGETLLSADAASNQAIVQITVTAPFVAGEPVILRDNQGNTEYATVGSITADVSLQLQNNLRNSFLAANAATITPVFTAVANATTSDGTNGDAVDFFPLGDRLDSLTYPVPPPTIP